MNTAIDDQTEYQHTTPTNPVRPLGNIGVELALQMIINSEFSRQHVTWWLGVARSFELCTGIAGLQLSLCASSQLPQLLQKIISP